jgi:hypothetical protein
MIQAFVRVVALTLTFAVTAASPATPTRYDVSVTERDLGAGAERGTLELRIADSGIVSGYYRGSSGAARRAVAGGRDGAKIWFDIGSLHVTAVLSERGLTGHAFRDGDPDDYLFDATPIPAP